MQKLVLMLLAISLFGSTALASAQTQPPPASPSTASSPAATTPQTGTSSTMTATAPGQPNFGELISSLNNMRAEVAKVRAMNGGSANTIRPVNVAQLSGADPTALNNAIAKNQADLAALRNTLSRTTVTTSMNEHITLAQFLADNKIGLNQVVGADVNNGMLLLFYQK